MKLEQIQIASNKALMAKDKERRTVIAGLLGAIHNKAIAKHMQYDITDALVNEVTLKEIKTAKEMFDTCPADRMDLKEQYARRIKILQEFVPAMIDDPVEITKIINSFGIDITKANRGIIMRNLKADGGIDMSVANKVLSALLQ